MSDNKPVLIEFEVDAAPSVSDAPEVPDVLGQDGHAMQQVVKIAARRPSALARWFWGLLASVILALASAAAWSFVTGLLAQYPILGLGISVLLGAFVLVTLIVITKELLVIRRLARVDRLQKRAEAALAENSLEGARKIAADLRALYRNRPETAWGDARLAEQLGDAFDANAVFSAVEQELLANLDAAAEREVEQAARQVATVTALVPLALVDVITALTANLRMIRRIAEIYAGRSGTLGSWRLTRAVMAHLVATGAVAVGDDLISSVAGGSLLGKISRRFGEGVVNGALTARVGVAAMEVCRPLAFGEGRRPAVTGLVKRALTGLFSK